MASRTKNGVEITGPWKSVGRFHKVAPIAMGGIMDATAAREASLAAARMREAILTRGASVGEQWPALSSWTSLSKGNEQLLRDTDTLLESIEVVRTGTLSHTARINPEATYPNGKKVVDIADVHELGAVVYVELTARMAKFLAIRARELGVPPSKTGDTPVGAQMLIRIPARPFADPTMITHFSPTAIVGRTSIAGALAPPNIVSGAKRSADGPVTGAIGSVSVPGAGLVTGTNVTGWLHRLFLRFIKVRL